MNHSTTHHRRFAIQPFAVRQIVLLLALVLLGSSTLQAQPALEFPVTAKKILFIGDSITHAGGYVAWIDGQLRLQGVDPLPQIVNIGLSSETCSGLSEPGHPFPRPNVHGRLVPALEQIKPDVVVACYGMNDAIYHPFDKQRFAAYQAGIKQIIERVHAAGAKIILLTPPPFDPLPVAKRLKQGETGPFGYQATYHDYEGVLRRYAKWIMTLGGQADMVIDIHTPMLAYTNEQRKRDPTFTLAKDGVHPGPAGHRFMAETILSAWGVQSSVEPEPELLKLLQRRTRTLHDAWLTKIGHEHPRYRNGPPLEQAQQSASELDEKIGRLVQQARQTGFSTHRSGGGTVYQVEFPPTARKGHLRLAVKYFLWIPDDVKKLRGIIVHQHGCGPGASIGGRTAADDLHWQALARRWDCALMGSSYEPRRSLHCRLWCDPRQGSAKQFLRGLAELAQTSGHAEVAEIPWCLWGHSGGGFWSSLMQTLYPERIAAIWLQSGTAYYAWRDKQIALPDFPSAMFGVPVLANPGLKERDHQRFRVAWEGLTQMRHEYLERGAPFFEFVPDPRTGHECGDSRYLAIPYFDFWLTHRLPAANDPTAPLRRVDKTALADWKQKMAGKVAEFIQTGAVADETPPPAPNRVSIHHAADGSVRVDWEARADFESGIRGFRILRDGQLIAELPRDAKNRFGRPLFQGMSYHDTPEQPLPKMSWTDRPPAGSEHTYAVQTVNSVGLVSSPRKAN